MTYRHQPKYRHPAQSAVRPGLTDDTLTYSYPLLKLTQAFLKTMSLLLLSLLSFSASISLIMSPVNAAPLHDRATLINNAKIASIVYDDDFDYVKLGRFSNLPLFPEGYRAPRHLVDEVVVYKSHHQMQLLKAGQVVKSYWIALSDRPEGDKQYEGDRRTPEGTYTLDYVKENSVYYRAFHISYPNHADIEEARKLGRSPGGMIMVHGQPASDGEYHETVQRSDWTNGCIAILNPEMDEFISLVDPGTPITIHP